MSLLRPGIIKQDKPNQTIQPRLQEEFVTIDVTAVMYIVWVSINKQNVYCKSTNFGVLLYLANLANCVSSLIFVAANIYVDRTLHRRAAGRRQI